MTQHPLEKLAATNPEAEIWWDSSPLIYPDWEAKTLAAAPADKRADWEAQLDRFYDADTVAKDGTMGFRGVTTNPPLSLQAIQVDPEGWRNAILGIAKADPSLDVEGVYWAMYLDLVKRGAEAIRPVFDKSGGKYGFLSGQVDPRFVTDGEAMLEQGLSIAEQGANVMVKIPGSEQGYEIIEELTARGISTNNTTSFTVPQYLACMNAVSRGLERAKAERRRPVDLAQRRHAHVEPPRAAQRLADRGQGARHRPVDDGNPRRRGSRAQARILVGQGERPPLEDAAVLDAGRKGRRRQHGEPPHLRLRRQRHGLHLPAGLHPAADGGRRRAGSVRPQGDRARTQPGEPGEADEAARASARPTNTTA